MDWGLTAVPESIENKVDDDDDEVDGQWHLCFRCMSM